VLINEWVKRLIKFGDLNEPKRDGGWTVYWCPELVDFIRSLRSESIKEGKKEAWKEFIKQSVPLEEYMGEGSEEIEKIKDKSSLAGQKKGIEDCLEILGTYLESNVAAPRMEINMLLRRLMDQSYC
jgi:hypothetical protein